MEVYKLVEMDSDEGYECLASMGWETRAEADAALEAGGVDYGYLVPAISGDGGSEEDSKELDTKGLARVEVMQLFTMGDSTGVQYWYAFPVLAYKDSDGVMWGNASEIDNNC